MILVSVSASTPYISPFQLNLSSLTELLNLFHLYHQRLASGDSIVIGGEPRYLECRQRAQSARSESANQGRRRESRVSCERERSDSGW